MKCAMYAVRQSALHFALRYDALRCFPVGTNLTPALLRTQVDIAGLGDSRAAFSQTVEAECNVGYVEASTDDLLPVLVHPTQHPSTQLHIHTHKT